jgi:NAD(P)-dependent dehydrogenase (short-subunit alcohol dehydrogenase family)
MERLPGIKLFDLTGRVAVVTGATKGLGFAISAALASAGAQVVMVSRNQQEADSASKTVSNQYGPVCIGVRADVCNADDVRSLFEQVSARMGRLDILVNNAGINIRGSMEELSIDDFRQVMQTNVESVWNVTREALPLLRVSPAGRIINLASTLGLVGLARRTPYASSKGAIVQMTRALGLELADTSIRVNAICPGPFLTPMNEPIANTEEAIRFIVGAVALGRWAEMQEIQGSAIYLASDASSYTTGSMLVVDGGWTAR